MARLNKSAVAVYFVSGARPNESQFGDLIDSYQNFSDFLQEISTALSTKAGIVAVSGSATTAYSTLPIALGGTGSLTAASALKALNAATAAATESGIALLASANVFTNENTFITSATDATEGPFINLDRRSDSAAGGDKLGGWRAKGRDSSNATTTYAKMRGAIISTSAGGETGSLEMITTVSGASAVKFIIAGGMWAVSASGGDRGLGTINLPDSGGYFQDGEQVEVTRLDTEQATTSGSTFDFNSPFTTTTRIIVMTDGCSLAGGTDEIIVQLGDASSFETSAYVGRVGSNGGTAYSGSGFQLQNVGNAGDVVTGELHLSLMDSANNTWIGSHIFDTGPEAIYGAGNKSLTGALTRVRLTRNGATDAFDAGAVNVRWYGY
jgi:hypothetical protein